VHALHAVTVSLEVPELNNQQGNYTVSAGDTFQVEVVVSDGNRDTGRADIAGLDQFNVVGTSQSTNISMINNALSSDIHYRYDVQADKIGTFQLGPARVKQNGKTIVSKVLALRVVDQGASASAPVQAQRQAHTQAKKQHAQNTRNTQERQKSQEPAEPEVLAKLFVNKKDVVVGEPIELFMRIYTRGPVLQYALERPTFEGFMVKEIDATFEGHEVVNGKQYKVIERRHILFPLQEGIKKIGPIQWVYTYQKRSKKRKRAGRFFDEFFDSFLAHSRTQQKVVRSNNLNVSVNELPAHTQRVDGVGRFSRLTAKIDNDEVTINEPIVLRLELEGQGNLDQISFSKLSLPGHMKYYKSKSHVHENSSQSYTGGKKTFEFVVQVQKTGNQEIPEQAFTYFDIDTKTYKTLKTDLLALNILPPPEGQGTTHFQQQDSSGVQEFDKENSVQEKPKEREEIHFIEEDMRSKQKRASGLSWWLFSLLFLLPLLLFKSSLFKQLFGRFLGKRSKHKLLADHVKRFEALIKRGDTQQLYRFFLKFLSLQFDADAHIVTELWIIQKLIDSGWPQEKAHEFVDFLSECASLHFVAHEKDSHAYEQLLKKARYWILVLNK